MPRSEHKIDQFDLKILDCLQRDGSLSNQEVAERVGLSQSPCSRRIRALETSGVIAGRRVILDAKKLGLNLEVVLMVKLDRDIPERFERFESTIAKIPQVLQCLMITGQDATYLLKIIVHDMEEYQDVLLNHITRIEGVDGVHSSFVLRTIMDTNAIPLA